MTKILFRHWGSFSAGLLLLAAAWVGLSAAAPASVTNGEIPAPRQGFYAPDFTLKTASGESIHLADLRGKPVLLNLWASWCPPCKAEMPAIQKVYQAYQSQGLQVLAVNATYQDTLSNAESFARSEGLTFPILYDLDGGVSHQYQLQALPTTFFITPQGKIQAVVVAGPMSEALIRAQVEQLLPEAP